jgi:N-formylglutamate amidohydrolase
MTALVDDRLTATGRAVIIDVHSYPALPLPYELHGTAPRPPVCLGTDPGHTPSALIVAAKAAFPEAAENTPFAGCYVPLPHHGRTRAVTALMVEIRRDGYMREPGGPPHGGLDRLAAALATLIAAA